MNVVVAPDSFKGSLSSVEAARAAAEGLLQGDPGLVCHQLPLADGGEGTVDAVLHARPGEEVTVDVRDPLGRWVTARYAWYPWEKLAVMEMAQASGLPLLDPAEYNPSQASSYGTGQLLAHALSRGACHILLGLGGSATVDGGVGCLQALGATLYSREGPVDDGAALLNDIAEVDLAGLHPQLASAQLVLASDVTNPLLGARGAAAVFGPQKGVRLEEVDRFDQALARWASVLDAASGTACAHEAGTGAAGGLGYALHAAANADIRSGFEVVADIVGLDQALEKADVLVTGEGRMDSQSFYGKVPVAAAERAAAYGVPTVAMAAQICGSWDLFAEKGIAVTIPIIDQLMELEDALDYGYELVRRAGRRLALTWKLGRELGGIGR